MWKRVEANASMLFNENLLFLRNSNEQRKYQTNNGATSGATGTHTRTVSTQIDFVVSLKKNDVYR